MYVYLSTYLYTYIHIYIYFFSLFTDIFWRFYADRGIVHQFILLVILSITRHLEVLILQLRHNGAAGASFL